MSGLQFMQYKVNEMQFKMNPDLQNGVNFKISPKIRMDIKQNEQFMFLTVTVTIDKHQDSPTPFELNVSMTAQFKIEVQGDQNAMRNDATAFFFPYVRSTVSAVTAAANIPAYYLPIIRFELPPAAASETQRGSVIIRPLEENI